MLYCFIPVSANKIYTSSYKYTTIKTRGEYHMVETTMTFSIEKELKQELKIIALKQDKPVKDILTELIQDYVNENK